MKPNPHRGSDFNDFMIEENLMNTDQPMKPYYYVYKHGDQGPRVRHPDLPTAQNEAERLAAKLPGQSFEILRCVGYASTSKASTFWMDGEGPQHPL